MRTLHRWLVRLSPVDGIARLRLRFHTPKSLHLVLQTELQLFKSYLFQLLRFGEKQFRTRSVQPAIIKAVLLRKLLNGWMRGGIRELRIFSSLHQTDTSGSINFPMLAQQATTAP